MLFIICYVQVWLIKVEYYFGELNKNFKRKRRVDNFLYHITKRKYLDRILTEGLLINSNKNGFVRKSYLENYLAKFNKPLLDQIKSGRPELFDYKNH